jgi:hypothetical protein
VPNLDEPVWIAIVAGTAVDVEIVNDDWAQVRWLDPLQGEVEGWIPFEWVDLSPSDTIDDRRGS